LASCATKPVQKTEPVVTETTGDVMVANGKNLYEGKCGKCHDLPKTNAYTAENG
jgi:cytochrome c5